MPTLIAGLIALYLLLAAIKMFGRMTPAAAAKIVRRGGGALNILGYLLIAMGGRYRLAALLGSLAFGAARRGGAGPFGSAFRAAGPGAKTRVSSARSATIETRLDLETGVMTGVVLGGRFQGRPLDMLTRTECLELYADCGRDDPDGARLVEAYLDRRFARWRDADEGQGEARGRARSGGAMTRNEAYEILGLAEGASGEEIIRAHRTLMKKLHPDHGGSTALAARVNQAKDVLLDRHG
ncbi:MAG TPA: DnaJ domain-containing protein [Roseiarcus sp.]|jgi:hypothetical protein